jgi:F5/8 type C domain-containing protein
LTVHPGMVKLRDILSLESSLGPRGAAILERGTHARATPSPPLRRPSLPQRLRRPPLRHRAVWWRQSRYRLAGSAIAALALAAAFLVPAVAPALTASAAATLLSQGQPATASSVQSASFPASAAVDGNAGTRWSSAFSDPQWLEVDLGASASISQVVLEWETAYATAFQIQTSPDGTNWTTTARRASAPARPPGDPAAGRVVP